LSKLSSKKDLNSISSKGSQRDIIQVYANGGIPLVFAILWYTSNFSSGWLYGAFLASLAAATADTWETEIGSFSKTLPLNILSWKRVPKGYSGGISLVGTSGGILGAAIIVSIAVLMGFIEWNLMLVLLIIIAGFLGSVIDSILGASIQAKFECEVCGKNTERVNHCHEETKHVSGILWLDNDWVNVAGSLSGGLIFIAVYFLFL
jgi:uncharacterized protein (TIGR00297 family)